jgi:hypothetical protein
MDSRLHRVLALFEDATPLTLHPCKIVTISGMKHQLDSKRLILNVIKFSPSPTKLIDKVLTDIPHVNILSDPKLAPKEWATTIMSADPYVNTGDLETLAENLLHTLVLPLRRCGTKTPSGVTVDPEGTENIEEEAEVAILLGQAVTKRSQSALKKLVEKRDGAICPVTKLAIQITAVEESDKMFSECAHVLPFAINNKPAVQTALEMFAPGSIHSTDIANNVNHPCNAINLTLDVHKAFDNMLWGIEAVILAGGSTPRYYYRVIKQGWTHPLIKLKDGDELLFGQGSLAAPDYLPNPSYCNIKLAVGRVLRACGAAGVIDYLLRTYDASRDEGAMSFLDGSSSMLDLLDISLHQIAVQ